MDDRLSKILAAVVPSQDKAELRILDSSDPAEVGKTVAAGPKAYELFLVNGSDHDIARINVRAGGFASDDDEVVNLDESSVEFGAVKAGGALPVETLDYGMLDFMLWYQLDLQFSDGVRIAASLSIPKTYGFREENYSFCPALDQKAYVLSLEPQSPPKDEGGAGIVIIGEQVFRQRMDLEAKTALKNLRPEEPPLGELTPDENEWLATAMAHLSAIYEKRAVGQPDDCCFCIFDFEISGAYVQFLAPFDAERLYCEAASPQAAANLTFTAAKEKLLHDFGFTPPSDSPNYSQRIQIDNVADIAFSTRLAFRVLKQVYEIADFASTTFKLNIPGEA